MLLPVRIAFINSISLVKILLLDCLKEIVDNLLLGVVPGKVKID